MFLQFHQIIYWVAAIFSWITVNPSQDYFCWVEEIIILNVISAELFMVDCNKLTTEKKPTNKALRPDIMILSR